MLVLVVLVKDKKRLNCIIEYIRKVRIAQLVASLMFEQKVVGSIPAGFRSEKKVLVLKGCRTITENLPRVNSVDGESVCGLEKKVQVILGVRSGPPIKPQLKIIVIHVHKL